MLIYCLQYMSYKQREKSLFLHSTSGRHWRVTECRLHWLSLIGVCFSLTEELLVLLFPNVNVVETSRSKTYFQPDCSTRGGNVQKTEVNIAKVKLWHWRLSYSNRCPVLHSDPWSMHMFCWLCFFGIHVTNNYEYAKIWIHKFAFKAFTICKAYKSFCFKTEDKKEKPHEEQEKEGSLLWDW